MAPNFDPLEDRHIDDTFIKNFMLLFNHTYKSVIRTSVTHSAVPYVPLFCCNPIWHHLQLIKQLLEEVVHNIMKYQCQGMSYLPKQKAEADNADMKFDKNSVNQIFFSIVNLLNNLQKSGTSLWVQNILRILHVHGWRAWKLAKLWTSHDNPISVTDIGLSCQHHILLTACSQPIRISIVSLMCYNIE